MNMRSTTTFIKSQRRCLSSSPYTNHVTNGRKFTSISASVGGFSKQSILQKQQPSSETTLHLSSPSSYKKCSHYLSSLVNQFQQHCFHFHSSRSSSSSKNTPPTASSQLNVVIVGSGPSGFYSAKYLQLALQRREKEESRQQEQPQQNQHAKLSLLNQLNIDLIDRLPTPYGLVRSGVAPDHPEVKNVENDFIQLFAKFHGDNNRTNGTTTNSTHTIRNEGIEQVKSLNSLSTSLEFRGNVHVGKDVSLEELRQLYDVVILAYGCDSDRKLGIEPSSASSSSSSPLPKTIEHGIYSAREFVAWYNGHPDFVHLGPSFEHVLNPIETANVVVIGQGNVALDCARILAKGRNHLLDTDIASHALDVLQNGAYSTTVVGRRGHVQGSFTIKELRELTKLQSIGGCNTTFHVLEQELNDGATDASLEELKQSRPKSRIDKLLRDVASLTAAAAAETSRIGAADIESVSASSMKHITLRFMLNPVKFVADSNDDTKLGSIICEKCELQGEPFQQKAIGTGEMEEIKANLALVSIGYKGIPLPGMGSNVFDEQKGIVKNTHGRVSTDEENDIDQNHSKTGGALYVSGWLKRGPSGIIGTNISDAKDTIASIMEDLSQEKIQLSANSDGKGNDSNNAKGRTGLDLLLNERKVESVDWDEYEQIDKYEKDPLRLRSIHQPREKLTSVERMLKVIR